MRVDARRGRKSARPRKRDAKGKPLEEPLPRGRLGGVRPKDACRSIRQMTQHLTRGEGAPLAWRFRTQRVEALDQLLQHRRICDGLHVTMRWSNDADACTMVGQLPNDSAAACAG